MFPFVPVIMLRMDGRRRAAGAVAARRGDLDLTQQQLADRSGVDPKTVGSLERGRRWPNARTRAKIEKALEWPTGEIERIRLSSAPPALSSAARDQLTRELGPEAAARVIRYAEQVSRNGAADPGPDPSQRLAPGPG